MVSATSFKEASQRANERKAKTVGKWLRRCLFCAGIDPNQLADLLSELASGQPIFYNGRKAEYFFRGISLTNDTETHQFFVEHVQFGYTLQITHTLQDNKITLTAREIIARV